MSVVIQKVDESYLQVIADQGIRRELSEVLTFEVPNHVHKRRMLEKKGKKAYSNWDGRIKLLDYRDGTAYLGLHRFIKQYCEENGYECSYQCDVDTEDSLSIWESRKFFQSLNLTVKGRPATVRDYQEAAFIRAIQRRRVLLLSPTASGKSAIIYLILRYLQRYKLDRSEAILLIVPKTSLVEQMYTDFGDYSSQDPSWDVEENCHRIHSGAERNTPKQIVITTWQSIYQMEPEWFQQFSAVIGDEAHLFDGNSLKHIMCSLTNARYRIATTGTLKESKVNEMVLEGLFGGVYKVTTTRTLMDEGTVADLTIKALVLRYSQEDSRLIKGADYNTEVEFIAAHEGRRKFVRNLALSLKGNTLILFRLVEKEGKPLYEAVMERVEPGRKVFYVHGKIDIDAREEIRSLVETQENAIIIASVGVFSTGVNITNLDNLIFATGGKSRVERLQGIGRGLRRSDRKTKVTVFDIVDDLSVKSKQNYSLLHFAQRLAYYAAEQFTYKIHKIQL